jgi:hypothetical protein
MNKFFVFFSILIALFYFSECKAQTDTSLTKTYEQDSSITLTYTYNGNIVKIIRMDKTGIRNGISEVYYEDPYTPEYSIIKQNYKKGILVEQTRYSKNGIIISNSVYRNGELTYFKHLWRIDDEGNLYYNIEINRCCNYIHYKMINDVVQDTIFVNCPSL